MKIVKLSTLLLLLGSLGYAGGDIAPITNYEIDDVAVAEEEAYIPPPSYSMEEIEEDTPIVEEEEPILSIEEPVVVEPEPIVQEPIVTQPKPPTVIAPKPRNIVPNGFYAGLGITGAKYKNDCKCKGMKTVQRNRDTTYGVMARAGYDFNQYIGVEARGSKTNWKSDGSKVEHVGVYVKPMLPVGNSSNIYALVGASKTKVKGSMPHVDNEGLALGGGIEIDLSQDTPRDGRYSRAFDGHGDQEKGVGLFVDYERMIVKKDAPKVEAVSAGVTYDF